MQFFKNHNINQIWEQQNLVVPKLINIDDHYRIKFGTDNNGFNKEVQKVIKEPKKCELFGEVSHSDEPMTQVEQPKPKKVKKVLFVLNEVLKYKYYYFRPRKLPKRKRKKNM